jgi:hypothetical protein
MRISPEPLTPLRNWRELWQNEPTVYGPAIRERRPSETSFWKQQKTSGFQWFNHLFSRELHK